MQDSTSKECGLHSGNIVTSAADQAQEEVQADLWPSGPVEALSKEQLQQLAKGPREQDTLVVLYAPWCQYSKVRRRFPATMIANRAGLFQLPIAVFIPEAEASS